MELTYLDAEDIRNGKLEGLDILVMPGGSGMGQYDALQEEGAEAIRRYVRNGGKYFGTCAGFSATLNEAKRRIRLSPYKRIEGHYDRGFGTEDVTFNEKWMKELALTNANWKIYFRGGPVVISTDAIPDATSEVMAVCQNAIDEHNKNLERRDAMIGTPAFVYGTYGKGEMIACNCHPEFDTTSRELISAVFGRLTGRRIAIPDFVNSPVWAYKADGTKETLKKAVEEIKQ